MSTLLVIPARLGSTRLPRKVLRAINGKPMIQHVFERCQESQVGPVLVACDSQEIVDVIHAIGGEALLTDPHLPSGSDRIWQALQHYDPQEKFQKIVNVQGDLPDLSPFIIKKVVDILDNDAVDIATAVCPLEKEKALNPNVVKAALAGTGSVRRALYFSRAPIPHGEAPSFEHIGLYAYKRKALETFVSLPPSSLELSEKLEQLRALEAGLRLDACLVDESPIGVDTLEDLVSAQKRMGGV